MTRRYVLTLGLAMLAGAAGFSASSAKADVAAAIETCNACHGEEMLKSDKTFPNINGQNRTYILNQLIDFKSGRRKSDIMAGIVAELTTSDMQGLATHFAKQPWPELAAAPVTPEVKKAGQAVLDTLNCSGCHHEHFAGDTVRPRLAGQNSDYLVKTMQEFRDKTRHNYIVMSAILNGVTDEELKAVSDYLATLPSPKAGQH